VCQEEESREPPDCLRMLRQSKRISRKDLRLDLLHGVRHTVVVISSDRCALQKEVPPVHVDHAPFPHDMGCAEGE
jgi:hypothetical protein